MNASFRYTDIYLTGPGSTFCPLVSFLRKKISEHIKKHFYLVNEAKIEEN